VFDAAVAAEIKIEGEVTGTGEPRHCALEAWMVNWSPQGRETCHETIRSGDSNVIDRRRSVVR
jgi:hypothetical protein